MSTQPILNDAMYRYPRGQVRVYSDTGKLIIGTSCAGYIREQDAYIKHVVEQATETTTERETT